jgi:hypothetical protein
MAKRVSPSRLLHLYRESQRIELLAPSLCWNWGDRTHAHRVWSLISVHVSPMFNECRAIPTIKTIPSAQLVMTRHTKRWPNKPTRSPVMCAPVQLVSRDQTHHRSTWRSTTMHPFNSSKVLEPLLRDRTRSLRCDQVLSRHCASSPLSHVSVHH